MNWYVILFVVSRNAPSPQGVTFPQLLSLYWQAVIEALRESFPMAGLPESPSSIDDNFWFIICKNRCAALNNGFALAVSFLQSKGLRVHHKNQEIAKCLSVAGKHGAVEHTWVRYFV